MHPWPCHSQVSWPAESTGGVISNYDALVPDISLVFLLWMDNRDILIMSVSMWYSLHRVL